MSATSCCRGSARSATVDESRPILAPSAHTLGAVRPLYEQVYTCFFLSLVSAMRQIEEQTGGTGPDQVLPEENKTTDTANAGIPHLPLIFIR